MTTFSLHIVQDDPDTFRWVLVELDGDRFGPFSKAEDAFGTYADALNAGAVALAAADNQEYENEEVDPVGAPIVNSDDGPHTGDLPVTQQIVSR